MPRPGRETFAALRVRDFRFLLAGTTLSNMAQWIQQVTLGWLVYDLTGSGTALGSINLVRAVAQVGLTPLAGVTIDRTARRPLMLGVQGWLLVLTLALGVTLASGRAEVWFLFVFAFLGGAAQTLDMPLRQTASFELVPRALAPNAVALVWTGWAVMRSLGPALGGALILWFGPAGNFFVQAGAHALIALSIAQIRFPARRATGEPAGPRASAEAAGGVAPAGTAPRRVAPNVFRDLGAGIAYVARRKMTRTFVMMGWILPLFIIPTFSALPPIYAKDVFQGGPDTLGLLMSAVGVGGIAGGFFTASLGHLERRGLVQLGALMGNAIALIAFALSPTLAWALLLLAAAGAFEMVYLTTNQTLLQLSIPDDMRGRVTSIVSLNMALSPIGAFIAGTGADLLGPRAITVLMSSVAAAIAVAVFAGSATVRDYRLSREMAPAV